MLIELSRPAATPEMAVELAEALRLPSGFGDDPARDARPKLSFPFIVAEPPTRA
jgi:hypothetical protein